MTRYTFGRGSADWIFTLGSDGIPVLANAVALTMWNAEIGGSQITDLLDATGTPTTTVTTGNGVSLPRGVVPLFSGPDDVSILWADGGGGSRVKLQADLGDAVRTTQIAVAGAQQAAVTAAAAAAELAASSSISGHVAAADPHSQYHNDARGDLRYYRRSWGTIAPLKAPLITLTFSETPDGDDTDMEQIYVTHAGTTRLVTWRNERGYWRAEQIVGAKWDTPLVMISAYDGTAPLVKWQRRSASNVREDVGGIDINGRVMTSLATWSNITNIDPGATGRYSIDTTTDVAVLGVRREHDDVCRLRGRIAINASGVSVGHVLAVLPSGYFPARNRFLSSSTSGGVAVPVEVMKTGEIIARRAQTGAASLSLDDLTYATGT